MKPVSHPSNTRTLAAPAGWDQNGLPVDPLGITDQVVEGAPCVWSFWEPDAAELAELAAGGQIVLSIVGQTMPPALLLVTKSPRMSTHEEAGEVLALVQKRLDERDEWLGDGERPQLTDEERTTLGVLRRAEIEIRRLREIDTAAPPSGGKPRPVTQPWVHGISMMQQSVLLAAIRGPDGLAKYGGGAKMLLRWYRRCILLSAMDGKVLANPIDVNGGSFTGPSLDGDDDLDHWSDRMQQHVNDYLRQVDALPHHYQMHFMHAVEIVGYKHPDQVIRHFWHQLYLRLVHDFHLWPETEQQLDERLGDSRSGWLKRADPATVE
jgi:hypothetical protein